MHATLLALKLGQPLPQLAAPAHPDGVPPLERLLQVDAANPLVGLKDRASLLQRLGRALAERDDVFGDLQTLEFGIRQVPL